MSTGKVKKSEFWKTAESSECINCTSKKVEVSDGSDDSSLNIRCLDCHCMFSLRTTGCMIDDMIENK